MQIDDLKITPPQQIQALRDVFEASKYNINIGTLLEQLKITVKGNAALKQNLQDLVSFFMLCQSNHQPRNAQEWKQVFDKQLKSLDRICFANSYNKNKTIAKAFQGIRSHHERDSSQQPRLSLGAYAMSLKTEQSRNIQHSYCFKQQKNLPVLCDLTAEVPINQTIKLKSKAFFAWFRYIELVRLNKFNKEKEITDIMKASDYHSMNLNFKAFYSCRQFVILQKAQKAKISKIKERSIHNHKFEYFQLIIDQYTITKIQATLSKKVLSLTNRITKVRALRKLKSNVTHSIQHQGYPKYYCVLFLRYMIETHCQKYIQYDANRLAVTLNACSKTHKASIQNQLSLLNAILLQKAFKVLRERKQAIQTFTNKINRRILSDVMQAYKHKIKYQKNQKIQLEMLLLVNKKYHLRRFTCEISQIPIRRSENSEQVAHTKQMLAPIQLKSSFNWFIYRMHHNTLISKVDSNNSQLLTNFRKISVLQQCVKLSRSKVNQRVKTQQLNDTLRQLQKRAYLCRINTRVKEIQFRCAIDDVANKQYATQLLNKTFGLLTKYTKQAKTLSTSTYTFYQWLSNTRKQITLSSWSYNTQYRKKIQKELYKFKRKNLKRFFASIVLFNQKEAEKLRPMIGKRHANIQQRVFKCFQLNQQKEVEEKKQLYHHSQINLCKLMFGGLKHFKLYNDKQKQLAFMRRTNQMKQLFHTLSRTIQQKRNTKDTIMRILKNEAFRVFMNNMKNNLNEMHKYELLKKKLNRQKNIRGFKCLYLNISKDQTLKERFAVNTKKIKQFISKRYIKIVSEDLLMRKHIKSIAPIVKRRDTYLIKQTCKHMRKAVPKLCELKRDQKKITRLLRIKFFKAFIKKLTQRVKISKSQNLKITPFTNHLNRRLTTKIFQQIRSRIAAKKNLVLCIAQKIKCVEPRILSDALFTIFEDYSFKSRCIAVCSFYKKKCVNRLMESYMRRSNQKLLEFKALKVYARSLMHKAINSLILNNRNQQNTINYEYNIQKWKTKLDGIGSRTSFVSRASSLHHEQKTRTRGNSFMR